MEAVDLLCSRNAHDQNVLVRRAQWETKQAVIWRESELARKGSGETADRVSVLAEPSRYSSVRSMGAMETTPAASLDTGEELAIIGRAMRDQSGQLSKCGVPIFRTSPV